ncbi:MAG: ATP-binding cassette domain-containing protein [Spirochaetia bacterium]|nr:ATP-binding cassette domain-containing protein [Spirochaetia bacterium]
MSYALEMHAITKMYLETMRIANDNVDLTLLNGEILSLAGENGAGKTTLMKILYGLTSADAGTIIIDGKERVFKTPLDAQKLKIGMVHQHVMLVDEFSVAQNVVLGNEIIKHGLFYDKQKNNQKVERLIKEHNFTIRAEDKVANLSIGEKQQVEILKMLYRDVKILILDEPTSTLTIQEITSLFLTLKKLQKRGVSIILITHKIHEIKEISDRVCIMREGKMIGCFITRDVDEAFISRIMMGQMSPKIEKIPLERSSEAILSLKSVTVLKHHQKQPLLDNLTIDVYGGEIVGCAGISGNGLGQLESILLGSLPISKGTITYHDQVLSTTHQRATTRKLGLPFVPSDRLYTGSSLEATVSENMIATSRDNFFPPFGILKKKINQYTASLIKEFDIKTTPYNLIGTLSGGNIQKVILAREIEKIKDIIICCEVTWGLDVGSAQFIHKEIVELRNKGVGVLLLSSNLDEILSLSDRLLIFSRGAVVAEFNSREIPHLTKEQLGPYLLGKATKANV